jgi:hypothetical protein
MANATSQRVPFIVHLMATAFTSLGPRVKTDSLTVAVL